MNRKTILAVLIIVAMLLLSPTTVIAAEGPESAPVTVSTLEELLQAIEQAEEGAVIGVGGLIVCPPDTVLGRADGKVVTIQRTAPEGMILFSAGDDDVYGLGTGSIQNVVFDGAGIETMNPFLGIRLSVTVLHSVFTNCNCTSGAIYQWIGNSLFVGCTFKDNSGEQGAHITISGTSSAISDCTFTGGTATLRAGAISAHAAQKITLTRCTITDNTAGEHGGGIWNTGILEVSQCKIYGNTANGNPEDIVNAPWGSVTLMDDHAALVDLYASDGLIPNKWSMDTFTQGPDLTPYTAYAMTFVEPEPEPEPTPEPEPEPTPEPDPDPKPEPETPTNTTIDNSTTDNSTTSNRESTTTDNSRYSSTTDSNNTSTVNNYYTQQAETPPSSEQREVQTIIIPANNAGADTPLQQTIQIETPEGTTSDNAGDMTITVNVAPPKGAASNPVPADAQDQTGFSLYQVAVICLLFGILVFLIANRRATTPDKKDM